MEKWLSGSRRRTGLKYAVLFVPAGGVGLWETIRHQGAYHEQGSTIGNVLVAILVFLLTLLLQRTLLKRLDEHKQKLQQAEVERAHYQAREQIAGQLHDGLAQSLFLLSVQVEQLVREPSEASSEALRKTMHHLNQDVRTTIAHLRQPQSTSIISLEQSLLNWVQERADQRDWQLEWQWGIPTDKIFDSFGKQLALQAIMKEIVWNALKHSSIHQLHVHAEAREARWQVEICQMPNRWQPSSDWKTSRVGEGFGLNILFERARDQGWDCDLIATNRGLVFRLEGKV